MRAMRKAVSVIVIFGVLATTIIAPDIVIKAADVASHGTDRSVLVSEDQLKTEYPSDYKIDPNIQGKPKNGVYTKYFLKDDLQTVKIEIDENNLNYMLQNATAKPTVMTDSVTIGGETVGYAGLKTKGNYTLRETDKTTSDRFSFTINFGKYVKEKDSTGDTTKQNFHGCKKISFNNFYFDKTMLKEYNALRLMTEMGVPTPAYGLAKLYINNQYYGVYAMVEALDTPILKRYMNSGKVSDYLTKPEGTTLSYSQESEAYTAEDGTFTLESLKNSGALVYDEENKTYVPSEDFTNINGDLWEYDQETFEDIGDMLPKVLTWRKKLDYLSQGKDFSGKTLDSVNSDTYLKLLEEIMDVDEVLRYFAAHSFIIQMDNMFVTYQNFGLYVDENGKSMLVPWDYDLGWGCFCYPCSAEDVANFGTDIMYTTQGDIGAQFNGVTSTGEAYSSYPLFHVIYQNSTLMERFREYMKDCAKIASVGGTTSDGRVYESGRFAETIGQLQNKVVAAAGEQLAPNVFYVGDCIQPANASIGIPNLKKVIALRSTGVWLFTNNIHTRITGYGCDMFTLGNAVTGNYTVGGELIAVNADTGIFAAATYEGSSTPGGGRRGGFGGFGGTNQVGPSLTVSKVPDSDSDYKAVAGQINGDIMMYRMSDTKTPTGNYTLYIPVSTGWQTAKFYTYADGALSELVASNDGNIYKVTAQNISSIVVTNGTLVPKQEEKTVEDNTAAQTVAAPSSTVATTQKVTKPKATKITSLKNTGKKKMTVKWKKISGGNGYQIQYSTAKSFKKSKTRTVTIKKKSTVKKVIKKLKKGKKYYVRIRVYKTVSGKKYYSKWCTKKSVKIKQ